jgi:integrase/recombinase XerC
MQSNADPPAETIPCPLQTLLAAKTNPHTRRAYETDIRAFLRSWCGDEPNAETIREFVSLPEDRLRFHLAVYKANALQRGVAAATVNRRLASVKALIQSAHDIGLTDLQPSGLVRSETIRRSPKESLVQPAHIAAILQQPDRTTPKGLRDYVLLRILLHGALRSAEVRTLRVRDVSLDQALLTARSDDGTFRSIELSQSLVLEIQQYLHQMRLITHPDAWLFPSMHTAAKGAHISGDGLYKMVREYARTAGVPTEVGPGDLRRSALLAQQGAVVRRTSVLSGLR